MFGPMHNMNAGLWSGGNIRGGGGMDMSGGSHGINGGGNIKSTGKNSNVKVGAGNNVRTGTGNNIIKTGAGNSNHNNIGSTNNPDSRGDVFDNPRVSNELDPEVTITRKKGRTGPKVVKASEGNP